MNDQQTNLSARKEFPAAQSDSVSLETTRTQCVQSGSDMFPMIPEFSANHPEFSRSAKLTSINAMTSEFSVDIVPVLKRTAISSGSTS
ncbi:MAG: hypothetical protein DWH81_05560 [Planctomycetota bacterium]|nr:MAG: hypothetical protein DWH81_05560 [Planctomycetota bacterium]